MLRFREIKDPKAALAYFGKSDGNYYVTGSDLHREVGGHGAELLGFSTQPDFDQFSRLLQGLDPHTGDQLTAKLVDNRVVARDVTASVPKGVTIALECGDTRVHDVIWNAGRAAMADLEAYASTRVRKGGAQDDRRTGNIVWYGWEHPETRPNAQDGMPDMDRHIHFVVMNLTYDPEEKEWKAMKFRDIMDLRKYFDRRFDMRVASGMTELGYEIETKLKAGRVEEWRGAIVLLDPNMAGLNTDTMSQLHPTPVSTPRSSNRTCRFPASGSHPDHHAFAFGVAARWSGTGKSPSSSYR